MGAGVIPDNASDDYEKYDELLPLPGWGPAKPPDLTKEIKEVPFEWPFIHEPEGFPSPDELATEAEKNIRRDKSLKAALKHRKEDIRKIVQGCLDEIHACLRRGEMVDRRAHFPLLNKFDFSDLEALAKQDFTKNLHEDLVDHALQGLLDNLLQCVFTNVSIENKRKALAMERHCEAMGAHVEMLAHHLQDRARQLCKCRFAYYIEITHLRHQVYLKQKLGEAFDPCEAYFFEPTDYLEEDLRMQLNDKITRSLDVKEKHLQIARRKIVQLEDELESLRCSHVMTQSKDPQEVVAIVARRFGEKETVEALYRVSEREMTQWALAWARGQGMSPKHVFKGVTDALQRSEQTVADLTRSMENLREALRNVNGKLEEETARREDLSSEVVDLREQLIRAQRDAASVARPVMAERAAPAATPQQRTPSNHVSEYAARIDDLLIQNASLKMLLEEEQRKRLAAEGSAVDALARLEEAIASSSAEAARMFSKESIKSVHLPLNQVGDLQPARAPSFSSVVFSSEQLELLADHAAAHRRITDLRMTLLQNKGSRVSFEVDGSPIGTAGSIANIARGRRSSDVGASSGGGGGASPGHKGFVPLEFAESTTLDEHVCWLVSAWREAVNEEAAKSEAFLELQRTSAEIIAKLEAEARDAQLERQRLLADRNRYDLNKVLDKRPQPQLQQLQSASPKDERKEAPSKSAPPPKEVSTKEAPPTTSLGNRNSSGTGFDAETQTNITAHGESDFYLLEIPPTELEKAIREELEDLNACAFGNWESVLEQIRSSLKPPNGFGDGRCPRGCFLRLFKGANCRLQRYDELIEMMQECKRTELGRVLDGVHYLMESRLPDFDVAVRDYIFGRGFTSHNLKASRGLAFAFLSKRWARLVRKIIAELLKSREPIELGIHPNRRTFIPGGGAGGEWKICNMEGLYAGAGGGLMARQKKYFGPNPEQVYDNLLSDDEVHYYSSSEEEDTDFMPSSRSCPKIGNGGFLTTINCSPRGHSEGLEVRGQQLPLRHQESSFSGGQFDTQVFDEDDVSFTAMPPRRHVPKPGRQQQQQQGQQPSSQASSIVANAQEGAPRNGKTCRQQQSHTPQRQQKRLDATSSASVKGTPQVFDTTAEKEKAPTRVGRIPVAPLHATACTAVAASGTIDAVHGRACLAPMALAPEGPSTIRTASAAVRPFTAPPASMAPSPAKGLDSSPSVGHDWGALSGIEGSQCFHSDGIGPFGAMPSKSLALELDSATRTLIDVTILSSTLQSADSTEDEPQAKSLPLAAIGRSQCLVASRCLPAGAGVQLARSMSGVCVGGGIQVERDLERARIRSCSGPRKPLPTEEFEKIKMEQQKRRSVGGKYTACLVRPTTPAAEDHQGGGDQPNPRGASASRVRALSRNSSGTFFGAVAVGRNYPGPSFVSANTVSRTTYLPEQGLSLGGSG